MSTSIHEKIAEWRKRILDLSKRNRLINCKVGARAAIEIEHPASDAIWQRLVLDNKPMTFIWKRDLLGEESDRPLLPSLLLDDDGNGEPQQPKTSQSEFQRCLDSPKLGEGHILTQIADRPLGTRLNRFSLTAKTSLNEQGVNILYIAFGLLRWYESFDSDVALLSPLLLVPVNLSRRGPDAPWCVSLYEEEIVPNRCLQEMLRTGFKVELPTVPEDDMEAVANPNSFFKQVRSAIRANKRWEVLDQVVLGAFSFQKLAMWEDLGQNIDRIANHDLCRAIAGDDSVSISGGTDLPSGSELDDRIHPRQVHTILDCDSSQLEAIIAVKNGVNLVLDGPPGTGKSQTIANIIAEFLAEKKTVLFVSEKAAALEVVKRRLDSRRLGDFCLECHSHKANKKQVISELGRCLALQPEEYRDQSADLEQLHTIRMKLNAYVRALHKPTGALNTTPYTVHGLLAELKPPRVSRCPIPDVFSTNAATLREIVETMHSLTRCEAVLGDFQHHPWRGCRVGAFSLAAQDDIQYGFDLLACAIDEIGEPCGILVRNGVLQQNPTKKRLEESVRRMVDALKHPVLPAQWFSGAPRKTATNFINLDSLSKEYREQVTVIPQLQSSSLDGTAAELVAAVLGSANNWLAAADLPDTGSVRKRQAYLLKVIGGAESLSSRISEVAHAVERFITALQVPLAGSPSLNLLAKLATLGTIIARTGSLKPSWFDDDVRNRLKQAIAAVQANRAAAETLRVRLAVRLCPTAFDQSPDPLIEDGKRLQDLRKRLAKKERVFRRRTTGLYADGVQKPLEAVFDDLKAFRRLQGQFKTAQQGLAATFNPRAFTVEGAFVVQESLRFHSPWYRLVGLAIDFINNVVLAFDSGFSRRVGGWHAFRNSASALYNGAPPEQPAQLLKDMASLRDFHLRVSNLSQALPEKMKPSFGEVDTKALMQRAAQIRRQRKQFSLERRAFLARADRFYIGASPDDPALVMQDLQALREYGDHLGATKRLEDENRDDLIYAEKDCVDLDGIREGIAAIEQIKALISIPEPLKQALTTPGIIDRGGLSDAVVALEAALVNLDTIAKTPESQQILRSAGSGSKPYTNLCTSALLQSVQTVGQSLREASSIIGSLASAFQDGHDLAFSELAVCLQRLHRLDETRSRVRGLATALDTVAEPTLVPELRDWASEANVARCVLAFLDEYSDKPPPEVVQVVVCPDIRDSVAQAVSEITGKLSSAFQAGWDALVGVFDTAVSVSTGVVIDDLPLTALAGWLRERIADSSRLQEWMSYRETEQRLADLKLLPVLQEIIAKEISLNDAKPSFLVRFYRLWLDAAYAKDLALRTFKVEDHEHLITRFRQLDQASIDGTYKRIRSTLLQDPDRPHPGMLRAPSTSEAGILLREVAKKKRHLSLRQLFKRIPRVLPRLKPCLMMSPLAVSTYLDTPQLKFDVVIFDEASQVRPFDAIGAIYRGAQLVVAGDQKQLPPTTFFDRMISDDDAPAEDDEEDAGAALADFESILDVSCSLGMPRKRLRWHYRSRREPLIAFSNHHFYANELVTFPSALDVEGQTAVSLHHVSEGRWRPGTGGGFNPEEARRTASLAFEHFIQHPTQSLGVITFNKRQQDAVLDEIDQLRRLHPEMEPVFDDSLDEYFFVKNLETVQGDERDRIIISVGYGFDDHGKFAMRFGPLNRQGGERRLNVAITRAKHGITVVSSVRGQDIDLSRTQSNGARLLRAYLEYAEHGVGTLGAEITEDSGRENDSEFEGQVECEVRSCGLDVRRQVGCGGYRIDLALVAPDNPGQYVLGIECDGASYHSSATARDRDRLRQEVLEDLGWHICRVWSTDWIRNPARQIERILEQYQAALKDASTERTSEDEEPDSDSDEPEEPVVGSRSESDGGTGQRYLYSKIEAVPQQRVTEAILGVLRRFGQTERDELIRAVARDLGFMRVGRNIQGRLGRAVTDLLRKKLIVKTESGLLSTPN